MVMHASRRQVLMVIGGGAIAAAAAGGVWLGSRTPTAALAPWGAAGATETEPRRRALSYAILAPNPHNRQPWLVRLSGDHEIVLHCDLDRRLPETDPFDRQITIGLGCFLELLSLAAAQDGYRAEIAVFPEGEPMPRLDQRPVARVRLIRDPQLLADPLFRFALARHTNREMFDLSRPVAPKIVAALVAAGRRGTQVYGSGEAVMVARLRAIAVESMQIECLNPPTFEESLRLLRIGRRQIEANPDGIALRGPLFELLNAAGLLDLDEVRDTSSSAFRQNVEAILAPMRTAMAYVWQITEGNKRVDQIAVGRDYLRIALTAAELGVGIHPQSQTLQEFEAMARLRGEVHRQLGARPGQAVQMLARLGYGPGVGPSPRWPLATRILEA
jgi:hypothetical protein